MMLIHPPATTDSFVLYVKASILLGKVKSFNVRFKPKYCEGTHWPSLFEDNCSIDPTDTAEFQALDNLIASFGKSFPRDFRDPVRVDGRVDPVLYVAHLIPHA